VCVQGDEDAVVRIKVFLHCTSDETFDVSRRLSTAQNAIYKIFLIIHNDETSRVRHLNSHFSIF